MAIIQVKNNGTEELVDRFDSVEYRFAPGESVQIPEEAAIHIFGYGLDDKMPNLMRLGWFRKSEDREAALARLNDFSFATGKVVFDVIESKTPPFAPEGVEAKGADSSASARGPVAKVK